MADPKPTNIPAPLSDRTHAHGRNVMAVAGVIVVLAWVPYIEITSFEPLGFDFSEGGELSVWGILAAVLVYYAIRFGYECWADYTGWIDSYQEWLTVTNIENRPHAGHVRRLRRKFWVLDVAPPAVMFLAALVATVQQVVPLVHVVTLVRPPPAPLLSLPLFAAITVVPQHLSIAGLSLDVLGVVFLVLFPLPESGIGFLKLEGPANLAERHPWLRWIGLPAIVIGFGLQIVANLIEIS